MKELTLTQGQIAKLDNIDFSIYATVPWHYSRGYAVRKNRRGTTWLHREIAGNPDSEVDHINGDKLDNRRTNLRPVTRSQNSMNKPMQSNNTTGYTGVHRLLLTGKFQAYIKKDNKRMHLGTYDTAKDAARAYCAVAEILFGDYKYKEKK